MRGGGWDGRSSLSWFTELLFDVQFRVAAQDQCAAIGGRKVDVEHLDGGDASITRHQASCCFMLAVVDLAEIQHLALHYLPGHAAAVLNNIPVPMFVAVFEASVEAQKHDANQITPSPNGAKGTWSTLQTNCHQPPLFRLAFLPPYPAKFTVRQPELRKLGWVSVPSRSKKNLSRSAKTCVFLFFRKSIVLNCKRLALFQRKRA